MPLAFTVKLESLGGGGYYMYTNVCIDNTPAMIGIMGKNIFFWNGRGYQSFPYDDHCKCYKKLT